MKKTTKKGFTLVELLVVIAILAILATVSVVGYTAFIERATVSNDENVAAQLNQFLTAMKADSTGEYYGKDITPDNVWEVIDAALAENGTLTDLEPQSLDYGYHYFYKFDKDESGDYKNGEIVVAKDKDVITTSGIKALYTAFAKDENDPGFFKVGSGENETLYFLLDTKGSSIAIAVRGFYTLDGIEVDGVEKPTTEQKFNAFKNSLSGNGYNYTDIANSTLFITSDGKYTTNSSISDNTEFDDVKFVEDNSYAGLSIKVNGESKEDTTKINTTKTINVPGDASLVKDSLNVENELKINYDIDSWDEVTTGDYKDHTHFEQGFVKGTGTVTIIVNGKTHTVNGNTIKDETNSTVVQLGSDLFPMTDFSITLVGDRVDNKDGTGTSYAAIDSDFALDINNIRGENGKPVSKGKVTYEIVSVNNNSDKNVINSVVKLANDKIEFIDTADGCYPEVNEIVITAKYTHKDRASLQKEIIVKVLRPIAVSDLALNTTLIGTDRKVHLANGTKDGDNVVNTKFSIISTNADWTYNYPDYFTNDCDIKFEKINVKLEYSGDKLTIGTDSESLTLASGSVLSEKQTVTINVGKYFKDHVDVTMYDLTKVTCLNINNQIEYIGNMNSFKLGKLFKLNTDAGHTSLPEGAEIWYSSGKDDNVEPMATIQKKSGVSWSVTQADAAALSSGLNSDVFFRYGQGSDSVDGVDRTTINAFIVQPMNDGNYQIISEIREIKVVNAYNLESNKSTTGEYTHPENETVSDTVKNASDQDEQVVITSKDPGTSTEEGHEVKTNHSLVLLGDYQLPENYYMDFASGKSLYGNLYELNLEIARHNSIQVIKFNGGALVNTKVIGRMYHTTNDPWQNDAFTNMVDYSASAVLINGNAKVINSYITGNRSPLRVTGSVTIKDTVLYGGIFANLDIQDSEKNTAVVTIDGLTTVSQMNEIMYQDGNTQKTVKVMPMGIVVSNSVNDSNMLINLTSDAALKQYNFIGYKNDVPDLQELDGYDLSDLFKVMFTSFDQYGEDPSNRVYSFDNNEFIFKSAEESGAKIKTTKWDQCPGLSLFRHVHISEVDYKGVGYCCPLLGSNRDVEGADNQYINAGIIYLKHHKDDESMEDSFSKITVDNNAKYPAGYCGISMSTQEILDAVKNLGIVGWIADKFTNTKGMTVISMDSTSEENASVTGQTFYDNYIMGANAFRPENCTVDVASHKFVYSIPTTGED